MLLPQIGTSMKNSDTFLVVTGGYPKMTIVKMNSSKFQTQFWGKLNIPAGNMCMWNALNFGSLVATFLVPTYHQWGTNVNDKYYKENTTDKTTTLKPQPAQHKRPS